MDALGEAAVGLRIWGCARPHSGVEPPFFQYIKPLTFQCHGQNTWSILLYKAVAFSKAWSPMPRKQGGQETPGSPPKSAVYEYEMMTPDLLFQPIPSSYKLTNKHLLGLDPLLAKPTLALSCLLNPIPCHCCILRNSRPLWTRTAVLLSARNLLRLGYSMAGA